jgi:tryptophan 6-halogenase
LNRPKAPVNMRAAPTRAQGTRARQKTVERSSESMANRQISHVTIVGGGTAGWMAATLLSRIHRRSDGSAGLAVSVIESPTIASVGVGEATVPAMPRTLQQLGISERDFFQRCNASFKLCVRFRNWNVDSSGRPVEYLNIFEDDPLVGGHDLGAYYTRFGANRSNGGAGTEFAGAFSAAPRLVAECRGPRQIGSDDFSAATNYAYHLDAVAFAGLLKETAEANGVVHIADDVVDVELDERGFVAALELERGGRHAVELVIDCTGFRSLVLQKALGEPFDSYGDYLMNDRALAIQIPHRDVTRLDPCTGSTALGAGWVWNVPLYSRIGTGYVFSSKFRSDEQARDEFMAHLGPAADGLEPRVIPLRIGHARRSWVKNCIGMGLSSGFIEPLESTAIYSIEMAIRWLYSYFPDLDFNPALADRYNSLINGFYDELRDFIALHFHLNNRTDSDYWIAAREEIPIPDSLRENLAVWQSNLPRPYDLQSDHLFSHGVYTLVLIAKGFYRDRKVAQNLSLEEATWNDYLRQSQEPLGALADHMPSHYDLVTSIRGDAPIQAPSIGMPGALV